MVWGKKFCNGPSRPPPSDDCLLEYGQGTHILSKGSHFLFTKCDVFQIAAPQQEHLCALTRFSSVQLESFRFVVQTVSLGKRDLSISQNLYSFCRHVHYPVSTCENCMQVTSVPGKWGGPRRGSSRGYPDFNQIPWSSVKFRLRSGRNHLKSVRPYLRTTPFAQRRLLEKRFWHSSCLRFWYGSSTIPASIWKILKKECLNTKQHTVSGVAAWVEQACRRRSSTSSAPAVQTACNIHCQGPKKGE